MLQYFSYLTLFIGIVPIIIFWIYRSRLHIEAYYFLPFITLLACSTLYEFVGTLILKVDVTPWFWIYLLLEFYTLTYFFVRLSINRNLAWIFAIFFGMLYIVLAFFRNSRNDLLYEGYLSTFSFVTFLCFVVLWFRKLFEKLSYPNLLDNHLFYFVVGIMVYFAGTIFLFLLSDVIYNDQKESFPGFWMLNVLFSFIFRVLIIIGIWKSRKE